MPVETVLKKIETTTLQVTCELLKRARYANKTNKIPYKELDIHVYLNVMPKLSVKESR